MHKTRQAIFTYIASTIFFRSCASLTSFRQPLFILACVPAGGGFCPCCLVAAAAGRMLDARKFGGGGFVAVPEFEEGFRVTAEFGRGF